MLQEISTQPLKARLVAILAGCCLCLSLSAKCAEKKTATRGTKGQKQSPPAPAKVQPRSAPESGEQKGEKIFKRAMCEGCHSAGNNALMPDRPIKGKAFTDRYSQDLSLEKTIRKGFPISGMPAFGKEQISATEMKNLILYIRSFTPQRRR